MRFYYQQHGIETEVQKLEQNQTIFVIAVKFQTNNKIKEITKLKFNKK